MSEPNRAAATDFAQQLTAKLMATAVATASDALRRELGPEPAERVGKALEEVIVNHLAPASRAAFKSIEPDLAPAARTLSASLALGLGDALQPGSPLAAVLDNQRQKTLEELAGFLEKERRRTDTWIRRIFEGVGAVGVIAAGALGFLLVRAQRVRDRGHQTILALAAAVKKVEDTDVGQRILSEVKSATKDTDVGQHLESILAQQPMLRAHVKKPEA
jgi:hypothetical protein